MRATQGVPRAVVQPAEGSTPAPRHQCENEHPFAFRGPGWNLRYPFAALSDTCPRSDAFAPSRGGPSLRHLSRTSLPTRCLCSSLPLESSPSPERCGGRGERCRCRPRLPRPRGSRPWAGCHGTTAFPRGFVSHVGRGGTSGIRSLRSRTPARARTHSRPRAAAPPYGLRVVVVGLVHKCEIDRLLAFCGPGGNLPLRGSLSRRWAGEGGPS